MNDLENYILSKEDSSLSPDELKSMGRRAAAKYLEENIPLNDSIKGIAKEASLNYEQIKRVVEFANNDTFTTMFKSGFSKNITFPMADANAVVQNIEARPMCKTAAREVITSKYIPGQESVSLEKIFGGAVGKEKVAFVDRAKVKLDYLSTKNKFDDASATKELLGTAFFLKLAEFTTLCKQASAEGHSPMVIGAAIDKGNPSKGLSLIVKETLGDYVELNSLEKVAFGGFMVPQNPITGLTQDLEGISEKLVATQQAVQKTQASMTELLSILKGPDMNFSPGSELFRSSAPPIAPPGAQLGSPPAGIPMAGPPPAGPPVGPPPAGPPGPPGPPMGAPSAGPAPPTGAPQPAMM